jgi:hypothetical protein
MDVGSPALGLKGFRLWRIRSEAWFVPIKSGRTLSFCFDALSSREPVPLRLKMLWSGMILNGTVIPLYLFVLTHDVCPKSLSTFCHHALID